MKTCVATLLAALSFSLVFSGCKSTVPISNGEVPDQYLDHAKKATGVYHGQFNNVSGDLVINFSGNRPTVTFKKGSSRDLLNSGCKSKIGSLREVDVKGDSSNPRITSAVFDFDPGQCRSYVEGRSLRIDFKEKNGMIQLDTSVVQKSTEALYCDPYPWSYYGYGAGYGYGWYGYGFRHGYPYNTYDYPYGGCYTTRVYNYLYGRFTR